ncbi:DUF397 domain-containing protein [Streptomyces sp. AcH 505]|uniref:DUF397 domain-containing protein n=1 Tax=Streptomyces sp. AcH 505 TaxID=352211 RepID=UPI0018E2EED3
MYGVQPLWHKSSFSEGGNECVEVAVCAREVLARDSKDREGPEVAFSRSAWGEFLPALQSTGLDGL